MSISDKIDKIRRKPEHIRMRYVLGGVAVCMFFIIIIWIFSMSETMSRSSIKSPAIEPINNQFNQNLENMPSIEEFMEQDPANTGSEPSQTGEELPSIVENNTNQETENISQ